MSPLPRHAVLAATTALAVVAAAALTAPSAQAAPAPVKTPLYQATAAGTAVSLAGGAVASGPTATSSVRTRSSNVRNVASVAAVGLPGVLQTGAVSTDSSTVLAENGTVTVTGHARTAKVNLLAGVVTVGAIETVAVLSVKKNRVLPRTTTRFTNLRIAGNPVIQGEVAPNTTIEVPGVARVVLNSSGSVPGATDGMAVSTAIIVTVLGGTSLGSTIAVNATTAQTARVGLGYAPLGGFALGAQVTVSGDATASVGPFGAIGMPDTGTGGVTLGNTLASADLGAVGTVGAISSTANGSVSDDVSRSTMTARVSNLSLLGGLITADTLTSTAEASLTAGSAPVTTASTTFTGLRVAGVLVPLDAAPGLVLPLAGLGAVAIRATATTDDAAAAAALTISVTTAGFGLPVGATVQIGFAYASIVAV